MTLTFSRCHPQWESKLTALLFCILCKMYSEVSTFRKCSLHLLNHLGNENLVILRYQECINVYRVIPEQLYFTRVEKKSKDNGFFGYSTSIKEDETGNQSLPCS